MRYTDDAQDAESAHAEKMEQEVTEEHHIEGSAGSRESVITLLEQMQKAVAEFPDKKYDVEIHVVESNE